MLARDAGFTTPPLVWLTINPIMDLTVISKMMAGGWPQSLVGDLWRFVVADDHPCQSLGEYVDSIGMDPDWWDWTVRTGDMAGSNYTTWRLCAADIPAVDWLAVESLDAIVSTGTKWTRNA